MDIAYTMWGRHLLGTHEVNHIDALKDALGVGRLEVILVESYEEYIQLLVMSTLEVRWRGLEPPRPRGH